MSEPACSDDALLGGRVRYRQPLDGYRVGLEAPLLAAFAVVPGRRAPRAIVDLASGPGAVGLCLAVRLPRARVALVERDPLHARLARENVTSNGFDERVRVLERDAEGCDEELGRGACDLVVSNPPWFDRAGGQPMAVGSTREASRGLAAGGFVPFCQSARQLLGRRGRLCMTAPAASLAAVLVDLASAGLVAKRLRWLHPRVDAPANVFFLEALAARPGGLIVEPPWAVRGEGEAYSPVVGALLRGGDLPPSGDQGAC